MFVRPLTSAITLLAAALLGRAELASGAAQHPSPASRVSVAACEAGTAVGESATGLFISAGAASLLDDEVAAPDEPEDGDPDRPGEALEDDGRASHLLVGILAAGVAPEPLPSRPLPRALAWGARGHPCFLSLCRFLC